ncbi:MAG TPA: RNA-guided pseudouridylation complex pseudouridine synthase subunit Cbf5 [Candidatus Nanoarchaeia archaeon]|nr:RNA-guided pseudouridylation complex pseudouridine synthase subunit Cbf5 [Candidatus Nanoarchaeia archaeon]
MTSIDLERIKQQKSISELIEFSILNIDKPSGPTSFLVSDFIRKNLGIRKTSHAGTLDPKVTGVLPVMLNRACKLSEWFMKKNKTYVGVMRLHGDVDDEKLKKEIEGFVGKIKQLPPVKSRVKREEREREVYSFEILERGEKDRKNVLFETEVEAGTYIRKIVHDLGRKIGGAHMAELRRTKAGVFSEQDGEFANLYDFEMAVDDYKKGDESKLRKLLVPAEIISRILPVAQVKKESMANLLTGKPIFRQDLAEELKVKEGSIAVFCGDKFIEVARMSEEGEILAKPEFVMN